ncbi:hypothetical protein HK105_200311 [Polyrhizophydium stewartii]|uniref:Extracellular metalloproteinase n=1 Tax=Polyrhizophydium stewartii TaxID=2732419 RepID=A0ABR4NL30_9FUNG
MITLCTLFVSLPLSMLRDISGLSKTSAVSLLMILFIVIAVAVEAFQAPAASRGDPLLVWTVLRGGIFQAIGVISFAFVCHHNTLMIYGSLKKPTMDRFAVVTHLSTGSSLLLCIVLACGGYAAFTDKTRANILMNLDPDSWLVNVARLFFGMNMFLTFPLECFVCREVVFNYWFMDESAMHEDVSHRASGAQHVAVTLALVLSSLAIALSTCSLGFVLELTPRLLRAMRLPLVVALAGAALVSAGFEFQDDPESAAVKLPPIAFPDSTFEFADPTTTGGEAGLDPNAGNTKGSGAGSPAGGDDTGDDVVDGFFDAPVDSGVGTTDTGSGLTPEGDTDSFFVSLFRHIFARAPDSPDQAAAVNIAVDFIVRRLNLTLNDIRVDSFFTDPDGTTHVYAVHLIQGFPVFNHRAAAHVKNGRVASFSTSFGHRKLKASSPKRRTPQPVINVTAADAVAKAAGSTGLGQVTEVPPTQEFVQNEAGDIVFTHKFQLRNDTKGDWVQVWSSTETGDIVQGHTFVNSLSYRALPLTSTTPADGFELFVNPESLLPSPQGWTNGSDLTRGNNVDVAKVDFATNTVLFRGKAVDGKFESRWDPNADPTTPDNMQAGAVNLFYVLNKLHDLTYLYGFDEAAGNFQLDNFGRGGKGGDPILANFQDMLRPNYARMFTPPDGQSPRLRLGLFNLTTPRRDPALDVTIITHEFVHGMVQRLTGGATVGSCLQKPQSRSLNEGLADFVTLIITAKPTDTRRTPRYIGSYVTNNRTGLRTLPFTTDENANPLKYSDFAKRTEPHDGGEVWTETLWELYWDLIDKYGFSTDLFDTTKRAGNTMMLQLVIGGMMRQPCNPSVVNARDAIIATDATLLGRTTRCSAWTTFSRRGLGLGASGAFKIGYAVAGEIKGAPIGSSANSIAAFSLASVAAFAAFAILL